MSPILKRTLHWGGSAVAIAGIGFVALRLHDYGAEIDFARFDLIAWSWVAALALIYGLSNLMLALAWRNLLGQFGACTSRRWAVRVYGISQIAKYVPGNIFHLAGRQALGLAAGLPGWALAKSALWELGLISVVGALFGVLALPLLFPVLPVVVTSVAFACALGLAAAGARRWLGPPVARALGWQAVFLAVSGGVFVGTLALVSPQAVDAAMLPALCGAYVIAWLAGLVTPGAPAGIGVRELVLLFLLGGEIAEADLLLAVVLARVVTVGGDLFYFIVAAFLKSSRVAYESDYRK